MTSSISKRVQSLSCHCPCPCLALTVSAAAYGPEYKAGLSSEHTERTERHAVMNSYVYMLTAFCIPALCQWDTIHMPLHVPFFEMLSAPL